MITFKDLEKVPTSKLIEAVMKDRGFVKSLVEELMLDEVLRGECDSVEFFKSTVDRVLKHRAKSYYERMLKQVDKEIGEHE